MIFVVSMICSKSQKHQPMQPSKCLKGSSRAGGQVEKQYRNMRPSTPERPAQSAEASFLSGTPANADSPLFRHRTPKDISLPLRESNGQAVGHGRGAQGKVLLDD